MPECFSNERGLAVYGAICFYVSFVRLIDVNDKSTLKKLLSRVAIFVFAIIVPSAAINAFLLVSFERCFWCSCMYGWHHHLAFTFYRSPVI